MADSSLDDFFAKKDKSKRKNKSAAIASSSLLPSTTVPSTPAAAANASSDERRSTAPVNDLTDGTTSGQQDQRPPAESCAGPTGIERPVNIEPNALNKVAKSKPEEDEWLEIEEEPKDYSGLKIQNLQINDLREEEQERIRMEESNEDCDLRLKESSGPWNKATATAVARPPSPPPKVAETATAKVETDMESGGPKQPKAYVPPALRSGGAASMSSSAAQKPKRKFAPEMNTMNSEEHFPSLSAATDVRTSRKGNASPVDVGFEAVKRGSRTTAVDNPTNRGPKLILGNKFDALSRGGTS